MEIIIQGKPISGSKVSTSGIEPSLVDRIYKDFFEKMGGVRTSHALIVDTIYWQNSWYSIYTYSKYSGMTDTADRQSYFALSIVVPKNFLYLTSGVYHLLQKTYKEKIEGVYISKTGKYLVSDFADTSKFNAIVEYLNREFANSNLEDPIDNGFQKSRATKIPIYNLVDCDSIAFLQDLKENGRIIVGEGDEYPKKCAVSVIQGKEEQIYSLNNKLSEKNIKIDQLNADLSAAQKAVQSKDSECSQTINGLNARIDALENEKNKANSQISAKQKELDDLVSGIQKLLPKSNGKPDDKDRGQSIAKNDTHSNSIETKRISILSIVNCVLLVFLYITLLTGSFFNSSKPENSKCEKQISSLERQIKEKDAIIKEKNSTINTLNTTVKELESSIDQISAASVVQVTTSVSEDVDCNVRIKTTDNNVLKNDANLEDGTWVIVNWQPYQGYEWHIDNLDNEAVNQLKQRDSQNYGEAVIKMKCSNQEKPIVLNYRTADKKNMNKKNCYKIKTKK